MADFILDGRTKVKSLKASFKENFGATLRVYTTVDCKELADDEATLASIRAEGFAGGEFTVKGNTKVGTFEKKVAELYGIGVQVANADDTQPQSLSQRKLKLKLLQTFRQQQQSLQVQG